MDQLLKISEFILNSFIHIWPYLIITIPLAVLVRLSGAAKYIHRAFSKNPLLSIFLATAVGAISPFCSCGVIPVITSLLIGGVPLGPVMSFWIASPSMDPEIFLLSVATVGWKLSVWRLIATFAISLSAGIITHLAQKKGFFGNEILRSEHIQRKKSVQLIGIQPAPHKGPFINCCIAADGLVIQDTRQNGCQCDAPSKTKNPALGADILKESWKAFSMVAKFMALAFFINALIKFYVPENFISGIIGGESPFPVITAAIVGIPVYTSNLTALPLVSGFISIGMNQGAALAFLIAGPVTTLPAMLAVWGIVKPRVFFVFLSCGLLGAVIFGYLFNLIY